jgi:hypothetical protein
MRTNHRIAVGPQGKAFERPPASFKDEDEIARWVQHAVRKFGSPNDPHYRLACFLAASSIVGPDPIRIARMLGLRLCHVALWAKNLWRSGIWQPGMVASESWHDKKCGFVSFILATLVADGLTERRLNENGEPVYRAIAGKPWWQNN